MLKVSKEYFKRLRKVLIKSKLNSGNLVQGVDTWAVSLLRYSSAFISWPLFIDQLQSTLHSLCSSGSDSSFCNLKPVLLEKRYYRTMWQRPFNLQDYQKQPLDVFRKEMCSWKFCKIHRKIINTSGWLLLDYRNAYFWAGFLSTMSIKSCLTQTLDFQIFSGG